jgi:cell division protein FtsB
MIDYRTLSTDQLVARLQIADSELQRTRENNAQLHRMIETLRDQGWATPRPMERHVNIRDYPMGGQHEHAARSELAKKLSEANERADHWRKKYMDLLDDHTGRSR